MKYHNKWLKILYKLLTLYESCLNLEWNSWHRTNNFEISWNFWNVVNLCYLIYNLFITFQLNLSLFLHIFKKNCINCQKKKKFICISHLSADYIKYWLQNNSISLFPWFPILFDVKEKNAIFLSLQGETLARITHKGRGGVYTIHHEDRNFLTYLHKLCSKLRSNSIPFKGMCTCTIVYVDTSHENASVVGCYHELKREEEKKKNNGYRRRIYSTENFPFHLRLTIARILKHTDVPKVCLKRCLKQTFYLYKILYLFVVI